MEDSKDFYEDVKEESKDFYENTKEKLKINMNKLNNL